ncbi:MAG: DUF1926 domain-containing protein [Candidatus Desulfofervidus auxilii]|nr:DUF1926 domain-containing protein [Candidatus Desulfofervidus auxilii]
MPKYYLPFAIHLHQPVGNFEKILEKAVYKCYAPFLKTIEKFPNFRFSLHISGPLWEWFEVRFPHLIDLIARLVERKQIELMAGGFYEPLLPFIPERDAKGQLSYMLNYLKNRFGVVSEGLWLTERVWTPELPKLLVPLGIKYTLVDDTHFFNAGLNKKDIHGYFITEKEGYCLFIFPIDKKLRYLIPFKDPKDIFEYFESFFTNTEGNTLTYGDDGEKFGLWPNTWQLVYKKRWLEKFLSFLEKENKIEILPLKEFLEKFPPRARIYLPPASYEEMMEWSFLPEFGARYLEFIDFLKSEKKWERYQPFVRGSNWDNFLRKYEESNLMHKKMILVSEKVAKNFPKYELSNLPLAIKHLWKAQCNCAYWHGIFGGLYLGHLRSAVYQNLIAAENALPNKDIEIIFKDYDCDGRKEWLFSSPKINAYIKPTYGGALILLEWREKKLNLTHVLTRRPETYHVKIREKINQPKKEKTDDVKTIHEQFKLKQPNLDKYLVYDWHYRFNFLDHFLSNKINLFTFSQSKYQDLGDFTTEPYEIFDWGKEENGAFLILKRNGNINGFGTLELIKQFKILTEGEIIVHYQLFPTFSSNLRFATELNLFLPNWDLIINEEKYNILKAREFKKISKFTLINYNNSIHISAKQPFHLWIFPIYTVNLSESGAEKTYQGTCFVFITKFNFKKDKIFIQEWQLKLSN